MSNQNDVSASPLSTGAENELGSDDEEEMVISAADLLGLSDTQASTAPVEEGVSAIDPTATSAPNLGASASEPVLPSAEASSSQGVMFTQDTNSEGGADKSSISKKRHERRSLGKRSLTLGGRQKSEKLSIHQLISHLERNFGNIVMLVSKSLDTLSDVFGKNKAKAGEDKAIKLAQQLTFHLSEVNIVITKVTNMCDGKTKVSTAGMIPDTVDEALSSAKHTLSVLLPKFKKMLNATKVEGAIDKIEDGLLEQIDEAMSDAAEQMDNLGNWLKDSGFGAAAGAVMLAMRWKSKAFGKKGGRHFGSIRIAPGGTANSPSGSFAANKLGESNADNDVVAAALATAKEEATAEAANFAAEAATAAAAMPAVTEEAVTTS
ncbi:hypothetical protein TrCOL_g7199 [Triparma columacea]|uniref:Uncharacterized protein n=1 Tax=Triparma columacea TaxID=722753 RepID=A0A9W7FXC2_9STRA|nr:hypothetical protein TrCOL_g7199 [Triparma columacea]